MANQIVLEWTVSIAGSALSAAQAQAALAAVTLYSNATTDPVLGQLFGLTVDADATVAGASTATRTLTLNMNIAGGAPTAPPPFPCHPRTSTPPVLPYPLRTTKTLPGFFFATTGSAVVQTTATQQPSLVVGDSVQFLSQRGVFYTVLVVGATSITLTAPYTGRAANTEAFKEIAAPVTNAALYSTSPLDTNGAGTTPAIVAGPGARTIDVSYLDSTGAAFTTNVPLTGRRPAAVTLAPGSIDIAVITNIVIGATGSFANSVGQITLVELTDTLPPLLALRTPEEFLGPMTDEAQMLIGTKLAYLPQSYFAFAGMADTAPQLAGDFSVTTGSTNVPTTVSQVAALAAGNTITFASQVGKVYTIADVTAKIVTLTEAYTGLDRRVYNALEQRIKGAAVINQLTGAYLVVPAPAVSPSNNQLAGPLAQFLQVDTAMPPPNPPLNPATPTTPTFLSDLFTRTIGLALAVPVTSSTITFV